jgi:hypothetical protein
MKGTLAATAAAGVLAVGALVAGGTIADVTPEADVTWVGPGTAELQPGQYVGPCSIVTPPDADPCQAAQLVLRHQFWGAMVNASWFKSWVKGSPNDYQRLLTILAAPVCSTFDNPQPQIMVTRFGEALANEVEAYACALGTEPITLPAADPPPTGKDKTPPTAPGSLHVLPPVTNG